MTLPVTPKSAALGEQIKSLEELRVKVAELCGWKIIDGYLCHDGTRVVPSAGNRSLTLLVMGAANVPDYPNDLNAIEHEMPRLSQDQHLDFISHLAGVPWHAAWTMEQIIKVAHATAEQRCRAFVATMEGKSVQ